MTEKQGGSDLRQTQTTARFAEATSDGRVYLLNGHKWFFSVPQSDGFFTLAQAKAGVTCFFVPGFLPDGTRNGVRLQRLKDKCGNRSNASSEIEYHDALAWLVGEEGGGIREILSHAHLTRLDFAIGSAGLMRQALTLALNHAQTRQGFGLALADQPMMTNILADLAIECEASTLMAFRVAQAIDAMQGAIRISGTSRASRPRWPSSGTASARRRSSPRRSNVTAATGSSRRARWRGSTARRPSTRSGRAPPT